MHRSFAQNETLVTRFENRAVSFVMPSQWFAMTMGAKLASVGLNDSNWGLAVKCAVAPKLDAISLQDRQPM